MPRRTDLDYSSLAKGGLALGVTLFAIGTGGEVIGHAMYETLPGWENALFFDLTVAGFLIGLFSPILFGIVLPLLE